MNRTIGVHFRPETNNEQECYLLQSCINLYGLVSVLFNNVLPTNTSIVRRRLQLKLWPRAFQYEYTKYIQKSLNNIVFVYLSTKTRVKTAILLQY